MRKKMRNNCFGGRVGGSAVCTELQCMATGVIPVFPTAEMYIPSPSLVCFSTVHDGASGISRHLSFHYCYFSVVRVTAL